MTKEFAPNLTRTEDSVVSTLAYYKAMGVEGLTLLEVHKYFLEKDRRNMRLFFVLEALENLKNARLISERNGFWYLPKTENDYSERIKRSKVSLYKWKRMRKIAVFLTYIPYTRVISVTGSVSLSNSRAKSDIDMLVRCRERRIWTTRFLVTSVSYLSRKRRYGSKIKNRLCFNHYLTEKAPTLGPKPLDDVVSAIRIPVWAHDKDTGNESVFALRPNRFLLYIKDALELFLSVTGIGFALEYALGEMQIKKIKRNPMGYPEELPRLELSSPNIIFYYPKVKKTESKYLDILKSHTKTIRTN